MAADTHPDLEAERQAEDGPALIRSRLRRGARASPLCLAVMGWLSGTPTEPHVADIRRTGEGRLWLRLSDEPELAPLCSFAEFLEQIEVICASVPLDEAQTRRIVESVRVRLR